ncbi:hypothetical protein QIH80_27540 [Bradyrhizobium elkanii]|nr:hypothetical protein QIH80_27540 [Bradyrhizobium elkanii]
MLIGKRVANSWTETSRPGGHLDRDILLPIRTGVEERLNRDGRLVVEQDDQLFADVNQRDLFIGDRRKVDLHLLVVSKIDDHCLIGQRLGQLVNSYGSRIGGIAGAGCLSDLKRTLHYQLRKMRLEEKL